MRSIIDSARLTRYRPSVATIAPDLLRTRAYVDGAWVEADTGATFPVVNPATGETLADVPRLGAAETRRAIEAAARALPAWEGATAKERAASCAGSPT